MLPRSWCCRDASAAVWKAPRRPRAGLGCARCFRNHLLARNFSPRSTSRSRAGDERTLFAVPLWHAWRVNVGTLRVFVPEDMQALPDLFHRQGADAVAAAVRSRSDPTGREVIVFAGPAREVVAGTMRRWP